MLCYMAGAWSQDVASKKVVNRDNNPSKKYLRPSITVLFAKRNNDRSARMEKVFQAAKTQDKYNNHNVSTFAIEPSNDYSKYLSENVSRQIVAKWFNRNEKGQFDMNLIAERGFYNASDADVLKANASVRKDALLADAGENLLDRSYILIYDIDPILTMDEYYKRIGTPNNLMEGYAVQYKVSVYKLDWTDSVAAVFYNMWTDASSPDPNKVAAFDKTNFPVKYVGQVSTAFGWVTSSQFKDHSKNIFGSYSDDELFARIYPLIEKETSISLPKLNEDFRVKTPVYSTHPIAAKIGLKEGLSVDKRFFVYEYELTNSGEKKAVRKAVIRATSRIADNRKVATGRSDSSVFYQVAGRKVYEGMQLQENPDWGIGLTVGYGSTSGAIGEGLTGILEMNASLWAGNVFKGLPPGIKIYAQGSLATDEFTVENGILDKKYNITSYAFGISKDLNFLHHFVLVPFVGYGQEQLVNTETDDEKRKNDKYDGTFLHFGARFAMNLNYNFQIIACYSLNSYLSLEPNTDNPNKESQIVKDWAEELKKGRGLGQLTIGLRYQF